jgi:hypothetical protein
MAFIKHRNKSEADSFSGIGKPKKLLIIVKKTLDG